MRLSVRVSLFTITDVSVPIPPKILGWTFKVILSPEDNLW